MWSIVNNFRASGDLFDSESPFVKWKPELVSAPSLTGCDGRNFKEKGLGVFSTCMKTDLAQRGVALLSKVVAARMVLLCAFARAVKLQRLGGTARVPGQTAGTGAVGGLRWCWEIPLRVLRRAVLLL